MSRKRRKKAKRAKKKSTPAYGKGEEKVLKEDMDFSISADVVKVDPALGLVLGWAIVCKERGEDYFDLQGDHIPEDAMLEAATDFMVNARVVKDMHSGEPQGDGVVFAFPMTSDIANSFAIQCDKTGLLVGMKPGPEMLKRFQTGELTGFSIGGRRIAQEELVDEA